MMKIEKGGFYKVSDLDIGEKGVLEIVNGLSVFLYDDSSLLKEINVEGDSKLEYFSYFKDSGIYDKHILLLGEKSGCKLHSLVYSSDKELIRLSISGEAKNNETQISMKLLSFAGEDGIIDLDGILKINKGLSKVEGRLEEENIFLGGNATIKGIPTLLVESNDVEASHACNIEKISDEKLFYLRSRGVGKENALQMIIEAKISNLFKCLKMLDQKFYDELLLLSTENIKQKKNSLR